MLNCREVTRLSSEASERPLTWLERLSLWRHTLACAGCRNFRRQLGFLHKVAQRYRSGQRDDDG